MSDEPNRPLTPSERKRFQELRRGITADLIAANEAGKPYCVKAGAKMVEIIADKLWREGYRTFNDFCLSEWGWGEKRGYQLADMARGEKILPLVENERQFREIKSLPQEDAEAVVAVAKADGPLTAAKITNAKAWLEEQTAGLSGKEKAQRQADLINQAEEEARREKPASNTRERKEKDRKASALGRLAIIDKQIELLRSDLAAEPDVAEEALAEVDAIQASVDRIRQLVKAAG